MSRPSPTRTGLVVAIVGLAIAVLAAATSFILTTRLSNEDALRSDMNTILSSVSAEVVANTDAFLLPASQTVEFLSEIVEPGVIASGDPAATQLMLSVLQANRAFDGMFVGTEDGQFLYVRRTEAADGALELKRIWFEGDERQVLIETYDADLSVTSTIMDPTDTYDPRERGWYLNAAVAQDGVWTDPYVFFSSGLPGVTRSSPVFVDGELDHVIGIDIRINQLSDFIAERSPSPNGSTFLMTRDRLVIAHPDINALGTGSSPILYTDELADPAAVRAGELIDQQRLETQPISAAPEVDSEQAQFIITPLASNPDWVATTWSPSSDFLTAVRDTRRTNTLISLGLGVIILLSLLAAAAWVFRRFKANEGLLEASEAASDRAEVELAETNEQLEASNRELEQYAYAAAHDLRTPLRAIGGYGELITRATETGDPDPEVVHRWATQIVSSYERMGQTMDNLLEHARLSRVGLTDEPFEVVDANEVTQTVLIDLTTAIDEAGGIVHIDQLPDVWGDRTQLGRVFQNLLENAIRFRSSERALEISIDATVEGEWAEFRVSDNGTGIYAENKSKIFESFTKADTSSGLGLGLSLVKRVIEDHGGSIHVESRDDGGTTFAFSVPATRETVST